MEETMVVEEAIDMVAEEVATTSFDTKYAVGAGVGALLIGGGIVIYNKIIKPKLGEKFVDKSKREPFKVPFKKSKEIIEVENVEVIDED